jgi:hypothetical protein
VDGELIVYEGDDAGDAPEEGDAPDSDDDAVA